MGINLSESTDMPDGRGVTVIFAGMNQFRNLTDTVMNCKQSGKHRVSADSQSRVGDEVRRIVEEYLCGTCRADLDSLTPMQRLQVMIKLTSYLLPHIKAIDFNLERPADTGTLASLFIGHLPDLTVKHPSPMPDYNPPDPL